MSQNSFQQMRQNFSKQRRRERIEQIFRSKRKQNSQKLTQHQQQMFLDLLPSIDMQNYEINKLILSDYARSTTYSYQMLPIAFICFEYLLSHPLDGPSWQILTYLSDYEDFQIPQTEQFAQILIKFSNHDPQLISQFLLNISKLPKCTLLCCRLIDASIFYTIEQKIHEIQKYYLDAALTSKSQDFRGKDSIELQIHNFLFALCNLFSIQPMIEIYQMNKICEIINLDNKCNRFLKEIHTQAIFNLIQNAVSNLSHQPSVIQLLFDKFYPILENYFFSFPNQSMTFLECCIKNKVKLSERLVKNLITSINCEKKSKTKVHALGIVRKILDVTNEKQKMQVQPNNFQTLQPFIQKNVSISFEDFNTMFNSSISKPQKILYQEEVENFLIVYSMLFTENYEQGLKKLFQVFKSSGDNVKEQIAKLILSMVNCLIREINNQEPNRILSSVKSMFLPEQMEQYLCLTVEQEETFYWIEQCLKNINVPLVENALQILMEFVLYFRDCSEEIEKNNSRVSFDFLVNQINKFTIVSTLEDLIVSENPKISELAEDLLQIIGQAEK